jgi:hypothetical protein
MTAEGSITMFLGAVAEARENLPVVKLALFEG